MQNLFQALYNYEVKFGVLFVIKMSGNLPEHVEPHWEFTGDCGEAARR